MKFSINNIPYLLALHSIKGLGALRLKLLVDYFEDPKKAWEAKEKDLLEIGLFQNVVKLFLETRKTLDPEKYTESVEKLGIKWITIYDEDYPGLLKEIHDPPVVLFFKGDLKKTLGKNIAIVGTRKITGYGKLVTEKFAGFLAERGLTIVSGLARGVDTIAHTSAVNIKGQTIAVLGGGLKNIFPPENIGLANKIINDGLGAIVSEFAPDDPSLPGNFPARNRIISGLSKAIIVTEAAEDSGSLITAKFALEQGREVFAIPGPITSEYSKGPFTLIKQGAKLVSEPKEILEDLGWDKIVGVRSSDPIQGREYPAPTDKNGTAGRPPTEIEKIILECLKNENKHVDEICRELKLPSSQVSASLVKMEIFGLVKNLGGGIYIRI